MARPVSPAAAANREVSVIHGGPKLGWGYFTDELTAQMSRCEENGIPFMHKPTGRFDQDGRRIWIWTGPDNWPQPLSTYDPERAHWHSNKGV